MQGFLMMQTHNHGLEGVHYYTFSLNVDLDTTLDVEVDNRRYASGQRWMSGVILFILDENRAEYRSTSGTLVWFISGGYAGSRLTTVSA